MLFRSLAACPNKSDDTGDSADTDTDTDTDSDTDADTDTDTDTDTGPQGLLTVTGAATVSYSAYDGTEEVSFVGDEGDGEELCHVTVTLASTEVVEDCTDCEWAFVVEVTDAVATVDKSCASIGWEDPASAVGSTRMYGYNPEYFGHAPVLLIYTDDAWNPAGYASWDESTGAFSYEYQGGYFPY